MMISVKTSARTQLVDITSQVLEKIRISGMQNGLCMIFVPHTTAAITINENADPNVRTDFETVLGKLIPWEDDYLHREGNSAAHVKSTIVGASELIAVESGKVVLGRWQGIFFCEFDGPRTRKVHLHFLVSS